MTATNETGPMDVVLLAGAKELRNSAYNQLKTLERRISIVATDGIEHLAQRSSVWPGLVAAAGRLSTAHSIEEMVLNREAILKKPL